MSRLAGVILSLVGGLLSILLSLFLFDLYPIFLIFFGELFVLIIQITMILGGLISIAGVLLSYIHLKLASKLILIGGLVAGGNFFIIIGAILIGKEIVGGICPHCGAPRPAETQFCMNCGHKFSSI